MPRPSRNVDALLLAAGRELYPATGAAGLSIRKVVERAGVNLGMFHYHFGKKEAFVRAVLQSLYEEMFAELTTAAAGATDPVVALREALRVIARFGRDHRVLLRRLISDAAAGERPARDFLRENLPRHVVVLVGLIAAGQRLGALRPVPIAQAAAFIAGAVASPILIGSAMVEAGLAPPEVASRFAADVLSDAALDERIELALAGLSTKDRR
jgi:AcrR family transcriptional regulator